MEEKRRKIVKASKSHFWEYCPGRFYPADNTGSKSRLPTLVSNYFHIRFQIFWNLKTNTFNNEKLVNSTFKWSAGQSNSLVVVLEMKEQEFDFVYISFYNYEMQYLCYVFFCIF